MTQEPTDFSTRTYRFSHGVDAVLDMLKESVRVHNELYRDPRVRVSIKRPARERRSPSRRNPYRHATGGEPRVGTFTLRVKPRDRSEPRWLLHGRVTGTDEEASLELRGGPEPSRKEKSPIPQDARGHALAIVVGSVLSFAFVLKATVVPAVLVGGAIVLATREAAIERELAGEDPPKLTPEDAITDILTRLTSNLHPLETPTDARGRRRPWQLRVGKQFLEKLKKENR